MSTNTYKESNSTLESLEELRTCISCYQPINLEEYVMWELTEFCNVNCTSNYLKSLRSSCSTCFGTIHGNDYLKYYMRLENSFILFCSYICLEKYSKSVKICSFCEKPKSNSNSLFFVSAQLCLNETQKDMSFCSDQCFKDFVRVSRMCPPVIPPGTRCMVCNIDDPVAIATKHDGTPQYFCGSRCQIAFNFVRIQKGSLECKMCGDYFTPLPSYTIRIFEGKIKFYFCSKSCKNVYMLINAEDMICSWCQSIKSKFGMIGKYIKCNLEKIFCSINCFINYQDTSTTKLKSSSTLIQTVPSINENEINMISKTDKQNDVVLKKTKICIWASHESEQRNVATMCSVSKQNKNVATDLVYSNKRTQTDLCVAKTLLPVPIPIYVPTPMQMFSVPVPVAVPIPIPIPIPVFLPCSQNSINKIINRVQEIKIIPNNICEAEMLQIAEIIAEEEDNKELTNETVSDGVMLNAPYFCESNIEICENIDVENALSVTASDITKYLESAEGPPMKFFKCEGQHFKENEFNTAESFNEAEMKNAASFKADMRLDYTLGINAWKQWASKTLHLHKNLKFIKSEILEMTPDELCFSLCLFVKELRKPNGDEYAPDTIYYLCLGIQYYLDINGRTDRIFFERIYEKFIECFDEFAKKFCTLYDDESHFIVTRVEEEHLWETKQLGCWSPYALLNTLVYFNTKYYCRANVEEHMELSFFHIMKAHKKSKADNYFILRLYPRPKSDDKQVYEQYQNKEDPLRCPVKLYEFYLSKCPESVKNSSNMLYLMPEKYVISESPLWYSATPLSKDFLATLLNRVKMIKEINVALLTP